MVSRKDTISPRVLLWTFLAIVLVSEMTMVSVSGRYLPTRSQDDRIDRLRELLRDLLGNQFDYSNGDSGVETGFSGIVGGSGSGGRSSSGSIVPHTVLYKRDVVGGATGSGAATSFGVGSAPSSMNLMSKLSHIRK